MAVGENVEARRLGQRERNSGVGVGDFDVGFGRGGEAKFDIAIAVVDFYLAGGIFDGHRIAVGAQRDVSRGIDDFEIAGAGLHVAGEGSKCEIGALRDEAQAFGDFVGTNGPVEFTIESEAASGRSDVDLATFAGDFDVAFGVGDFDVALVHFDGHVAGSVADFHVAAGARYGERRSHIGDGNIAFFISDFDVGFHRDLDVHVDCDASVTGTDARGMDFVTVAILNDFNGNWTGAACRIVFAPGVDIFLAGDADFGHVGSAHGDVAAPAANRNACVGGNVFGRDVQVKRVGVAKVNGKVGAFGLRFDVVDCHDGGQKRNHADDQKDFAAADAGRAAIVRTAGDGALVKLDRPKENKREGPPVEHFA